MVKMPTIPYDADAEPFFYAQIAMTVPGVRTIDLAQMVKDQYGEMVFNEVKADFDALAAYDRKHGSQSDLAWMGFQFYLNTINPHLWIKLFKDKVNEISRDNKTS